MEITVEYRIQGDTQTTQYLAELRPFGRGNAEPNPN